jgi:hypothetical protein
MPRRMRRAVSDWLAVLPSRVRVLDLNGHHVEVGILETAELPPPPLDTLPGVQASDVELSFRGPAASVNGADNYMKASAHPVGAVKSIDIHRLLVDGSDAAAFYDLHIDHPVDSITIADWYQLEGDRICAIRRFWILHRSCPPVARPPSIRYVA